MMMENSNTGPIFSIGIKSRKKEHVVEEFVTMYNILKWTEFTLTKIFKTINL